MGTWQEVSDILRGPIGNPGLKGEVGETGPQGPKGKDGAKGDTGDKGFSVYNTTQPIESNGTTMITLGSINGTPVVGDYVFSEPTRNIGKVTQVDSSNVTVTFESSFDFSDGSIIEIQVDPEKFGEDNSGVDHVFDSEEAAKEFIETYQGDVPIYVAYKMSRGSYGLIQVTSKD